MFRKRLSGGLIVLALVLVVVGSSHVQAKSLVRTQYKTFDLEATWNALVITLTQMGHNITMRNDDKRILTFLTSEGLKVDGRITTNGMGSLDVDFIFPIGLAKARQISHEINAILKQNLKPISSP